MALAKHIQIAREEGPKAGFNAWITQMERSGLPQVQDRLAEVKAQGNKKAQFEYYCNVYGKRIFDQPQGRNASQGEVEAPQVGDDVQALFAQFLTAIGQNPGVIDEADEDTSLDEVDEDDYVPSGTTATRTTTRSSGRSATKRSTTQGADQFAPRNPQDDATSGRLWKLNELGLLTINAKPGKRITNGQAHTVLAKNL